MSLYSEVQEKYREDFPEYKRPHQALLLPRSLAKLTSEKLSDLMLKFTQWREYTEDLQMEAFVEYSKAKQIYDHAYNTQYILVTARNKEEREARTLTSQQVVEANKEYEKAHLYYTLIGNKLQGTKDTISIISREITRRGTLDH